jgi:hypothetical protein
MFYTSKIKDIAMKKKKKSFLVFKPIELGGNLNNNLIDNTEYNTNYNNLSSIILNEMQETKSNLIDNIENRKFEIASISPLLLSLKVSNNSSRQLSVNKNRLFSTTKISNDIYKSNKIKKSKRDKNISKIIFDPEATVLTIPKKLYEKNKTVRIIFLFRSKNN